MTPFRPTDLPTTLILEAWIRFAASAPGPTAALYADELLKEFLARWERPQMPPPPPVREDGAEAAATTSGFDRGRLDQFGGGDP
jgi:hypothetical protein